MLLSSRATYVYPVKTMVLSVADFPSNILNSKQPDLFDSIKWICCSRFLMKVLNTRQDAHNKKRYESHFLNGLGFNLVLMALDKLKTFDLLNHSYLFYGLRPLGPAAVIHLYLVLKCYFLSLIVILVIKVIYIFAFSCSEWAMTAILSGTLHPPLSKPLILAQQRCLPNWFGAPETRVSPLRWMKSIKSPIKIF